MIPGITASATPAAGGGGAGGTALAMANFATSTYSVGVTSKIFTDCFTEPGTGCTSGLVVDSSGAAHDGTSSGVTQGFDVIGDFAAALVGAGTRVVYMEVVVSSTGGSSQTLELLCSGSNPFTFLVNRSSTGHFYTEAYDNNGPSDISANDEGSFDVVSKIAVRVASDTYKFCTNGGTVHSGTMGSPAAFSSGTPTLQWTNPGAPVLKVLAIYDDMTDAALQSLTT